MQVCKTIDKRTDELGVWTWTWT